jgi:hypothetical protein
VLDPYALVRSGAIAIENVDVLGSKRLGRSPTAEEIKRGDYTNFPWERYRGDGKPTAFTPLLWGQVPAKDWWFVAFADGSVRMLEGDKFRELGLAR